MSFSIDVITYCSKIENFYYCSLFILSLEFDAGTAKCDIRCSELFGEKTVLTEN